MYSREPCLAALGLGALLLSVGAAVASGQAPAKPAPPADGLIRSELSLIARTVTVAYSPLKADDPAHADLLSETAGSAGARVRIGRLDAAGPLRIGTADLTPPARKPDPPGTEKPAIPVPAGIRDELWLARTADGWQLQVVGIANESGGEAPLLAEIPLPRKAAATASPTFVAALIPETADSARLLLRWGRYEAATDVHFPQPQRQTPPIAGTLPNVTTNRTHDEDLSAVSRFLMLTQRSETAFTLANGSRLSVSYQRTPAPGERTPGTSAGGGQTSRGLPVTGPDFMRLATTPVGGVVQLTAAGVPRLKLDVPLRFGNTLIATANQAPGYPGSYGIWLKRAARGWRLVLNHEADAWGSQHDPKFDAAEIAMTHSEGGLASRPFTVALVPTATTSGRLVILWGPHEWTADFVTAQGK